MSVERLPFRLRRMRWDVDTDCRDEPAPTATRPSSTPEQKWAWRAQTCRRGRRRVECRRPLRDQEDWFGTEDEL